MKLALLGFGGVAKAFIKLIENKKTHLTSMGLDLEVLYIFNSKACLYIPDGIPLTDLSEHIDDGGTLENYPLNVNYGISFDDIFKNKDVDLLVELTSTDLKTGEPALTYMRHALEGGIHVVTGNKGPIQLQYRKLKEVAFKNQVQLGIGCTVGGALPSMNGGLMDMAGASISKIEGVLNGTSNHIINLMENHGITYKEALKMAQREGIAESNPALDVEGWDTATKLLILTNVLCDMDRTLDDVIVEGITHLTHEEVQLAKMENKKYKLVGSAKRTHHDFIMHVKLEKLDSSHPFFNVDDKNKAVRYTSDTLGELTLIGGASGTTPAAASILRDIINIHKGYNFI